MTNPSGGAGSPHQSASFDRRQFLEIAVASGVIGSLTFCSACSADDAESGDGAAPDGADVEWLDAVIAVGHASLAADPSGGDDPVGTLNELLGAGTIEADGTTQSGEHPDGTELASVGQAVRDDFAGGRIVELDGWMMSQTESRFAAAVAALIDPL